ncbi:MAG TPA: hypothetical protein VLX28_21390 [Thermoanaerobaculia bacterium]|nr:hypothetical protein [Thermoanaerobaculia bacterium]
MNGQFELTVKVAGVLSLPARITHGLSVVPGDLFFLHEELPGVLSLEIYHELLADNWEALSPVNRWRYLEKFLSRPVTALSCKGDLAIPEELFPLRKGENVWLWVARFGLTHKLLLFQKDKNDHRTRNGDNGAYEAAGSVRDAFADGGLRGPVRSPLIAESLR